MIRFIYLVIVSSFLLASNIFSQTLTGQLTLNPYPSPYVSDWENNPAALGSLTFIKGEGPGYQIRIRAIVSMQGKGEVFRSITNPVQLTSAVVQVINNTQLIGLSDATFTNSEYEKKMRITGRLLEGNYTACLTIENMNGVILANNICANFTILYPSAPQLIFPANNTQLESIIDYPTFQWTPVIVPPAFQIKYTLRIVEILTGQTPSQAINANVPVYENNQININSFTYPIEAMQLVAGKKYAWQVQALDQLGYPATQNIGRSEIFLFTKKNKYRTYVPPALTLNAPDNNSVLKTKTPKFTWGFSEPSGNTTKYYLRVVKVLPNQTLETAIKNYPILNQLVWVKTFQPSQMLTIVPGETYAWQITAFNYQTNDTLQQSEIRKFTVFPLALHIPSENGVVNMKRPQFQWSYTGDAGKYYDIKVIKLPMFYYNPQGIIEEDLFNDVQNIIYQKYNLDGAQLSNVHSPTLEVPLFTPNTDIPMEEGKDYYWQISAKDQPYGTVIAKSEIRKLIFNPYQPGFATNCNVSGQLQYQFAKPGEYNIWPLKNINIKFVVKYMLHYSSHSGNYYYGNYTLPQGEIEVPSSSLPYQYQGDYNKTIAIGKTDGEGNFSFSFMNLKQLGVVDDNFVFNGGNEFNYTYTGKLHRVIRLMVESPYYNSPDEDIIVQPGETKYFGPISYVKSYSLTVNVKSTAGYWSDQFLPANSPIGNMLVYILRKNKPTEVPENEGSPATTIENESPFYGCYQSGYRVVAKSVTNSEGNAFFDRLVKSVYSQNDEYFIYSIADSEQTSLNYTSLVPIKFEFKNYSDNAVFNNQYKYQNVSKFITGFPLNPFIKGIVKRNDKTTGFGSNQPLADAQVKLLDWALFWWQEEATNYTNPNGRFKFENLTNVYDGNGDATGPIRGLKVTKYGFRDTTVLVKSGAILKIGEFWQKEILLEPDAKVFGKIVNENGSGISSNVTLVGGETVISIPPIGFLLPDYKRYPATFELKAPKGYNKVIVDPIPYDNNYLKDTIDVYVNGSSYDMGTITIKKALHRIRIFAGDKSKAQGEFYHISARLPGSKIRVETQAGVLIEEKLADTFGFAEFIFANPVSQFKITVVGPTDRDFEIKQVTIVNYNSKDKKNYDVLLEPAAKISGHVYVGTQNQPVANARVTIKGSTNTLKPETFTDNNGFYVLHNVPKVICKLTASKKSSNLIGDETNWVNVSSNELNNVNLNLKVYSEMDITHLLGFPIEVDNLIEENNVVKITGKFVDLDSLDNNLFSSTQSSLNFTKIPIIPDPNLTTVIFGVTVPVSKPKTLPLQTDANNLNLKVFDKYSGSINDNNIGVELIAGQTGKGAIKGKVKVSEGSFSIPQQKLKFDETGFYLRVPNSNDQKLSVITADKTVPYNTNKFLVVNSSFGKVGFKLHNFNSDASITKSFLYKDSLILNTNLHTQLEGITPADINLNIGDVSITTNTIKPLINKTTKINLALGNWTLEINKWSLNGVLSSNTGTLKTGLVDLPLQELNIEPNKLSYLTLNFNSMTLGGVAPLKVNGSAGFGYESQGNKKWYITVSKGNNTHAASFGGLPGMEVNDSIYINSFSLYSDGTKTFSPQNTTLDIYKVGKLSLDQLIAGTNSIEMSSLSFNIPKLGQMGAIVRYFKENNQVKFKLVPVPININTNGINLSFGNDANTQPITLNQNGLKVRGIVSEDNKFSFYAWLYHSVDSTSIWIETPNTPNTLSNQWQKQTIGGPLTYLEKINGNMKVVNNYWQNLWYSGNLITPSGIDPNKNKVTFTVFGDIVATNQEIGVKGINSPFGGISLTFEPDNKRFIGSLSVDKDLGYAIIKGQLDAVVDDEGWYFFSGGELYVKNPESKGSAALLLGHHSITNEMKNTFQEFSYVYKHKGSLPMTFPTTLSGFYFEGMASIPVQSILGIPNIDIDLVVLSARLWVNAGADMRTSLQFSNNNLTVGAGMDNFIEAGFSVSQWLVVECSKLSFGAALNNSYEGQFSTDGTWSAEIGGDITLTGEAKVGWGICDSDCEGKLCDEESWSGHKVFGILGHIGSDGKYMNFYSK
ncbi:MAG: carboxypeptidase regulatory-like domain-containing protein [Ignavibacteriales bacterium]|nr:carboxypeptidase regulatory-like domain-containing protein [Ignavibacteriales bacterium]